jgi:putative ABC transport system permease protein
MLPDIPLAWLQLTRERSRFFAALAGVTFAVILVFMQLGFSDALYASSVRLHDVLAGDLFLIHPQAAYLMLMKPFSRRRLYQTLAFDGVESVTPVYTGDNLWKNPITAATRDIFIVGIDPTAVALNLPEVNRQRQKIRRTDIVLFDEASRPEFGPVAQALKAGKTVATDIGNRRITVAGLFRLGTSFGIDGTMITSEANFLRLLPMRTKGLIDIGVITLRPGVSPEAMQKVLAASLPRDVEVLTKRGFEKREKTYWATSTPIGFVFAFGTIMGLVVGLVIVYQILFADISDHLAEYATLKAMGYRNRDLFSVVFQEASILAILGFTPGFAISLWFYRVAEGATLLPMRMTPTLIGVVLMLTITMCCASGAMALHKVRTADPAEVF